MGKLSELAEEMLTLWHDMSPAEKGHTVRFMRAVRYAAGRWQQLPQFENPVEPKQEAAKE